MSAPARFDDPVSRRTFLARAAALGISASVAGPLIAACAPVPGPAGSPVRSPGVTPAGSLDATAPLVAPTPAAATYGPLLEASELVAAAVPSSSLAAWLTEVATDGGIPLAGAVTPGSRQARVAVSADDSSIADQGYRLEIVADDEGPRVTIHAGSEAGALYGLQSLRQLIIVDGATVWLRTASIDDVPGFSRRGAILDPAPRGGDGTPAARAELEERVRLGVRYKLNFVDLPSRTPWPDLVGYCADHHVELMVAWGYRDALTTTPRRQLKDQLAAQQDAGARSICLNWDDIDTSNGEALAAEHADIFLDLYRFLRARDAEVRLSIVMPPYGGVPGHNLVFSGNGQGERYLEVMRSALPDDVRVFWTGDGGVFSDQVTTAGARAYRDAIGHEVGLWDNDTIRYSRERQPCRGRDADLDAVLSAYMGNLAGEANWSGTNGEFALLTSLFYTWNPAAYEPTAAAASVERILAG